MTNPTFERAARAADALIRESQPIYDWDAEKIARAVLMAVLPTLERYDSDHAGEYQDERGDYVLYADLQAILNDGERE